MKNTRFQTPQQVCKLFYRAHRIQLNTGCNKEIYLFYQVDSEIADKYFEGMISCVCAIFFPIIKTSKSEIRRYVIDTEYKEFSYSYYPSLINDELPF